MDLGACASRTHRWPGMEQALLVVNSVKVHLTALNMEQMFSMLVIYVTLVGINSGMHLTVRKN